MPVASASMPMLSYANNRRIESSGPIKNININMISGYTDSHSQFRMIDTDSHSQSRRT
jgi:hypothetical protein